MVKYSESTDEQTTANLDYIDRRWRQLHEMENRRADTALNYLFLVSGGAAAATLTYIGNLSKDGTSVPPSAFWMLGLFSVAVLLVGLLKIWVTYKIVGIFMGWRTIVRRYYSDEITWIEALQADEANVRRWGWIIHILAWLTYFSIAGGVAVGFFKLQEESARVRTEKAASSAAKTSDKTSSFTPANDRPELERREFQYPEGSRSGSKLPAATADKKEVRSLESGKQATPTRPDNNN